MSMQGVGMPAICVVDDEKAIVKSLIRLLRKLDVTVEGFSDSLEALDWLHTHPVDILICDQRMPKLSGSELLAQLGDSQQYATKFILSAYSDFSDIIDAFNDGLIHKYVAKPWDDDALLFSIEKELQRAGHRRSNSSASSSVQTGPFPELLGHHQSMQTLFQRIQQLSTTHVPIFIYGETGTGKELVARALHNESHRHNQPFVSMNCANFSETLMESQLFGYKKGAFTGADRDRDGLLAAAEDGTLFLDEVTTLPMGLQSKLLRVLQEREFVPIGSTTPISFNCQIISASAKRLQAAVDEGKFRDDLMYRLEVIPLGLPPLRERHGDILMLFSHFTECNEIVSETAKVLEDYSWPGNVRELQNASLYARAFCNDGPILVEHLPDRVTNGAACVSRTAATKYGKRLVLANDVREALRLHNSKSAAARSLGMSRMTLWRHMARLDLT